MQIPRKWIAWLPTFRRDGDKTSKRRRCTVSAKKNYFLHSHLKAYGENCFTAVCQLHKPLEKATVHWALRYDLWNPWYDTSSRAVDIGISWWQTPLLPRKNGSPFPTFQHPSSPSSNQCKGRHNHCITHVGNFGKGRTCAKARPLSYENWSSP